MKKWLKITGGLVLAFIIIALLMPSKHSDNKTGQTAEVKAENGLTLSTFQKIENGMNLDEVEKLIGTKGEQTVSAGEGIYKMESYTFKNSSMMGVEAIVIMLTNNKVTAKSQIGLK